jgi:sugar phosphate isomerase/epimerase
MLNDRGMMGDGVVDLKGVRAAVEAVGYAGFSEVEIFSEAWGERPLAEVLETCIARHKEVV